MPSPSLLPQRRMTVPDPNKSRCTRRQTAGTPLYNPLRLPLPPRQNPPSRNIRILLSASDVVQKLQPNETRPSAMNSIQHTKERGITDVSAPDCLFIQNSGFVIAKFRFTPPSSMVNEPGRPNEATKM